MARVGGHRYCYKDVLPFTALVAMECSNVGLNTLFKFATNHGMSRHVFVVYAYAVAALVLLPAMFLCRSRSRVLPQLNFSIMIKTFLLGVIGWVSLTLHMWLFSISDWKHIISWVSSLNFSFMIKFFLLGIVRWVNYSIYASNLVQLVVRIETIWMNWTSLHHDRNISFRNHWLGKIVQYTHLIHLN